MKLQGMAAIVTGGASGLGQAAAEALAQQGARVAVFDMNGERAAEVASGFGGLGIACDVTDAESVTSALDHAEATHGVARVAVNCAGIAGGMRLVGRNGPVDMEKFGHVIAVNLLGTVSVMSKAAARMMAATPIGPDDERGVVINTASIAAFEGQIGQGAYAASKGAIVGLTLQAAREFAPRGIRVMTIAPGLFRTPILDQIPVEMVEDMRRGMTYPPRFGDPAEFGAMVVTICENAMLNGETIRLDGAVRLQAG